MMDKRTYITAVIVVFGLLLLSRIPAFINGSLDAITVVSSIVELGFLVWGILVLRRNIQ
ncbi:MAG: hypothetical protein HC828_04515 [Blastochloris sp.]|nr:hypothetical protein [Blastochloris sp.]